MTKDDMPDELLRCCPLCGGEVFLKYTKAGKCGNADIHSWGKPYPESYQIKCSSGHAVSVVRKNKADCIRDWNHRAEDELTRPTAPNELTELREKPTEAEAMRVLWDAGYQIHGQWGWVQDGRKALAEIDKMRGKGA